jgi:hypothetical protein
MIRYLTMRAMEKPTSTVLYLSFFLVRWLVIADSRLAAATWASCAPLCKTAGPHPRDAAGRRRWTPRARPESLDQRRRRELPKEIYASIRTSSSADGRLVGPRRWRPAPVTMLLLLASGGVSMIEEAAGLGRRAGTRGPQGG